MRPAFAAIVAFALPLAGAVPFQSPDPPARVARLSYLAGDVSLRADTVDDWTRAELNYPVSGGDNVWTGDGARAELQLGSTTMQLAPQTAFAATVFDARRTQASITQGSLAAHVRFIGDDGVVEFDTPAGAVTMERPGDLRIDVSPDGRTTTVTVRHGEAEIGAGNTTVPVRAGTSATLSSEATPVSDLHPAAAPDDWEEWCLARDRAQDDATSARYVSREMPGYADLDAYGVWRTVPDYGPVWVPRAVVAGWAPYRFGHWAWIAPWGWTWIDDAPWGYAPFHYGRWAYWSGSWVWVPGTIVARPVYAPALVAFVGGSHWSVSVDGGPVRAVGWFPLAPGEVYYPAYRASPVYVRNVNITNVRVTTINVTNVNVTNVRYANRAVPGAVTAVRGNSFAPGQPVGRSALAISQRDADAAPVMTRGVPDAPRRMPAERVRAASLSDRAVPPAGALSRRVVTRSGQSLEMGSAPRAMRATDGAPRGGAPHGQAAAAATGERSGAAPGRQAAPAPERGHGRSVVRSRSEHAGGAAQPRNGAAKGTAHDTRRRHREPDDGRPPAPPLR